MKKSVLFALAGSLCLMLSIAAVPLFQLKGLLLMATLLFSGFALIRKSGKHLQMEGVQTEATDEQLKAKRVRMVMLAIGIALIVFLVVFISLSNA